MGQLLIELLSDTAPGTGEGETGGVDRDISRTSTGLPFISARRLKGCLREVALEIAEALEGVKNSPEATPRLQELSNIFTPENIKALFGTAGSQTSGWLKLENATLENGTELESWLKWAAAQSAEVFGPEAVLRYFTTLRRQTSMSRVSGGPLNNTLRTTRVIARGTRFYARVSLVAPTKSTTDPDKLWELLKISASRLQRLGLSRNRGTGEVKVSLEGEYKESQTTPTGLQSNPTPVNYGSEVYRLRYTLELRGEALFSNSEGDPNLLLSEGYVPGSAVWGALAYQVIRRLREQKQPDNSSEPHENPLFRKWFLEEGLRCLNAIPLPTGATARLIPAPLSLPRKKEDKNTLVDLTKAYVSNLSSGGTDNWRGFDQLKRVEGFGLGESGVFRVSDTQTHFNYHTSRPDRIKGRADEGAGAVFVYEALDSGQKFSGGLLGTGKDLEELCQLLGWTKDKPLELQLGRSRMTQYGGAAICRLETSQPEPYKRDEGGLYSGFDGTGKDKYLVVTLTSPLLGQNEYGYPLLEFPVEALANLLGLKAENLVLVKSFARRSTIGSYSSVLQLPRPQWPAFEAGSVFIFELKDVTNVPLANNIEAHSLGIRTGEGFGRFVLGKPGNRETLNKRRFESSQAAKPRSEKPGIFNTLVKNLAKQEWKKQAETKGLGRASNFEDSLKKVSPAQLARLHAIVKEAASLQDAQTKLSALRPTSRQQLERVRSNDGNKETLLEHIQGILNGERAGYDFRDTRMRNTLKEVGLETDNGAEIEELKFELARLYLLTLLGRLSRLRRSYDS